MPQEVKLTLPRLHSAQQEIRSSAHRFNVLACGRRFGKTTLGVDLSVETTLAGQPLGWYAPTYRLLSEAWRELRRALAPVTRHKSETEHRLELVTGGILEAWSLDDNDAGRGRKYKRVIIDEAALVKDLEEAWNYAIRPTLTDLQGDGWLFSTPRGLNYFHTLYQRGQSDSDKHWASWRKPSDANPFLPPEEVMELRTGPERMVAQEVDALFIADGTGVFRNVEAVSRLQPCSPEKGHAYAFGIDWGQSDDYTVLSVIDIHLAEQVAMERFNGLDYDLQPDRIHAWANLYRPIAIVAEANSMGQPLVQRLQRGYARSNGDWLPPLPIVPWWPTNASKAAAIQDLALAIQNGDLTLLADDIQRNELLAFDAERLPSGMLRYSAPRGMHDDTVIALMLAWQAAKVSAPSARSDYAFAGAGARQDYRWR